MERSQNCCVYASLKTRTKSPPCCSSSASGPSAARAGARAGRAARGRRADHEVEAEQHAREVEVEPRREVREREVELHLQEGWERIGAAAGGAARRRWMRGISWRHLSEPSAITEAKSDSATVLHRARAPSGLSRARRGGARVRFGRAPQIGGTRPAEAVEPQKLGMWRHVEVGEEEEHLDGAAASGSGENGPL